MRTRRIGWGGATDRWAHDLYRQSFPAVERAPWWLVHLMALRPGIDLVAWWDSPEPGAAPCALTYTARRPGSDLLLLFYLAVDPAARGSGTGTRVLGELGLRHRGASIVLEIEPVVDHAPNPEQRRRRLAFYERAGFHDTGLAVEEPSGEYWVLARPAPGREVSPEELIGLVRYTGLGLGREQIRRRRD